MRLGDCPLKLPLLTKKHRRAYFQDPQQRLRFEVKNTTTVRFSLEDLNDRKGSTVTCVWGSSTFAFVFYF